MAKTTRKIVFTFDERDFVSREDLERRGFAFHEVPVRDASGNVRILLIPTKMPPPLVCFPQH